MEKTPSFIKIAFKTNLKKLFNSGLKGYLQSFNFIFIFIGFFINKPIFSKYKKYIYCCSFLLISSVIVYKSTNQYLPWAIPLGFIGFNLILGDTFFEIKNKKFNFKLLLFLSLHGQANFRHSAVLTAS